MTINHLVLCGGGPIGVVQYGILKKLSQENIIKLDEITSIYATSVGGFIAFIYMLNFDWECMDDFIIKRPWENLFKLGISDYLNIFYTKGLISINTLIEALKPLYLAKNIPIDITMQFVLIDTYQHSPLVSNRALYITYIGLAIILSWGEK